MLDVFTGTLVVMNFQLCFL